MKNGLMQTQHRLINGDARNLSFLEDNSVHLVVTSPPYWNLTQYNENSDQLGIVVLRIILTKITELFKPEYLRVNPFIFLQNPSI